MRKTREILRHKWLLGRSHRDIAKSLGVGVGTVSDALGRARAAGLGWPAVAELDDAALEERLYRKSSFAGERRPLPDWRVVHAERSRPGVTLELLHLEYLEQEPGGYRYSQFCELYRRWLKRQRPTMRQVHKAGEKGFFDYSGKRPHVVDPKTGECTEVELFVAVLGASNFTFAEATRTQRLPDWIASHARAFCYFGGVPRALVPDQLKSAVTIASRYEPGVNRTYEDLARHYGTAVLPARPHRPRDKAKVEGSVLIVQRWILARLRNQSFFSLDELNARIAELLEELNDRQMRRYGESRRQLWVRLERPALLPLPSEPFTYGEWKTATVNVDYHVEIDRHYYSVHHGLLHEKVEARVTATTVEIFFRGRRHTSHVRSYVRSGHTTKPEHMPKAHQKHLEWSPSRILHWASTIGEKTEALARAILESRPHPEQGYRSCLGILRLGKRYGDERLEAACGRALAVQARSYRNVESILKRGLDRFALPAGDETVRKADSHENIRGPNYYH
jgi:transposase